MNQALQLIEENQATKSPELDLRNCELFGDEKDVFEKLAQCDHLEVLHLGSNWVELNYETNTWEHNNSENKGIPNRLIQIPQKLPPNLRELNIVGSYGQAEKIQDISPLRSLEKLEHLRCWHNDIQDLSPLADLKNLKYLHPGGNARVLLKNMNKTKTFS